MSRHWDTWPSCGADEWTVGVFQDGYQVPFHHLPPVSQVPIQLSSAALGTACELAFQEEVNTVPVEIVQQPRPGFYSCLFLVKKVTRGWRPVIDPSSFNNFVTINEVPDGNHHFRPGISLLRGLDVLCGSPGRIFVNLHSLNT